MTSPKLPPLPVHYSWLYFPSPRLWLAQHTSKPNTEVPITYNIGYVLLAIKSEKHHIYVTPGGGKFSFMSSDQYNYTNRKYRITVLSSGNKMKSQLRNCKISTSLLTFSSHITQCIQLVINIISNNTPLIYRKTQHFSSAMHDQR
jgi:hypothetical protein